MNSFRHGWFLFMQISSAHQSLGRVLVAYGLHSSTNYYCQPDNLEHKPHNIRYGMDTLLFANYSAFIVAENSALLIAKNPAH